MIVYQIVQNSARTKDLSGTGAYRLGGRWNSKGTYMLYTSENSSLAYLESIVHFDPVDFPPLLYLMKIEIADTAPIYTLRDKDYPTDWKTPELLANKAIGDRFVSEARFLGLKVKSAVNPGDYNLLLNPVFPGYQTMVKVIEVMLMNIDARLLK